jgi:DNA-binding NarL/FixJ family response regulator
MVETIRVLIADDHPLFRDGLRTLLGSVPETSVVGETSTGDEAVVQAALLQPDVILMDLHMPGLNGIEATRSILHTSPHIGILVLTMFEDDGSIFSAMRAGARGYLLKGADQAEILRAITAVSHGEAIFSSAIAGRLMHYFTTHGNIPTPSAFPELTGREREILALIAQGDNNAKVAERLMLSPKTVRNHVSNIFSKLQVVDRAQAIIRAREAGLK